MNKMKTFRLRIKSDKEEDIVIKLPKKFIKANKLKLGDKIIITVE